MKKILLRSFIAGGLVLAFCSWQVAGASVVLVGGRLHSKSESKMTAPDFSLSTVAGKTVVLKDLRGNKSAILFFFTTWCPYCLQKLPMLAREYENYQSEGIELLAIDVGESKAKVASFSNREHLPFDILLDEDMKVSGDFDVLGVPTVVLVSKDGVVLYEGNDLPHNYKELLAS